MNDLMITENAKKFLKKIAYNIYYRNKFQKFNIDKSLSETLIDRSNGKNEKEIFHIINKSKTQEEFEDNVIKNLKLTEKNIYANSLLIGNITGKYVFNDFYYKSLNGLNIDAFSKESQELLAELKLHFPEYIINNNNYKNTFANKIKISKASVRDLSQDINQEKLVEDFDQIINGEKRYDNDFKSKIVTEYIMKTIGIYTKEDIKNNFNFILYDINNDKTCSIDERREEYLSHCNLSDNQLRRINEFSVLKKRLQKMKQKDAKQLLLRLDKIENALYENVDELDDIYRNYEVLYRQDLIGNLYEPKEEITIVDNFQDVKPQLIHMFIRLPQKFRDMEIKKIKEKIISERMNKNSNDDLTIEEQKKFDKKIKQLDVNLNQYQVNYAENGLDIIYSDASGLDSYHSDTSNQISASIFAGKDYTIFSHIGIIGIGFNGKTLSSEAIATSSDSYKTTNKGLNNIEYNIENEFKEMSVPFSELLQANGRSEIVMHRRGIDYDTKASYIFATIDSSNPEKTKEIMKQIEQARKKEGLQAVIYDMNKIRQSIEQSKQEQLENDR